MSAHEEVARPRGRITSPLMLAGVLSLLLGVGNASADDTSSSWQKDVYPYTMKGRVRLLLFWVGKEDVGGGTISISEERRVDGRPHSEEIEVLFGSKPERVPGGHNRWGYGRERSQWADGGPESPSLEQTIFEGFMRHSKEKSMSEVRASEGDQQEFWYDGIRSIVRPNEADSQIRYFSTSENFDYRNSKPMHSGYQKRMEAGPPDKLKHLTNDNVYRKPYGFLTATRHTVRSILSDYQRGAKRWTSRRSSLIYVHNARLYRLSVRDIDYRKTFELSLPNGTNDSKREIPIANVAEIDFRIEKIGTDYHHDFTLWVPLRGPVEGIPLRIVDKPRWWLQIELNLAPGDELMAELRGPQSAIEVSSVSSMR